MAIDRFDITREIIQKEYGVRTSFDGRTQSSFGVNRSVASGTEEMVWLQGGIETLPTDNTIDTVSSSDAGDAVTLLIEGNTISANGLEQEIKQTVTVDGQNKVTLDTPLARITNAYNISGTNIAGTVYFYKDGTITAGVPNTASDIHLIVDSTNKSLKASIVVPHGSYFVLEGAVASVLRNVTGAANFILSIKPFGGVWIEYAPISVANATFDLQFKTPAIIEPNHDIRVTVNTADNNLRVSTILTGFYMTKV